MEQQQKQRSSLTVQAFWLLIAKTLAFVFAFALPVLLTRTLSQSEYGLFKQVFLIVTTATALLPLGFGMSSYYYLPREKNEKVRGQVILNILLFNFLMGAAACLLLVFWPGLIAKIGAEGVLATALTIYARARLVALRDAPVLTLGGPVTRDRQPVAGGRDDERHGVVLLPRDCCRVPRTDAPW